MKVEKVTLGLHTVEFYAGKLKYHQVQKSIDHLVDLGDIQIRYEDPYGIDRKMTSSYLVQEGVRMRLYQSYNKSNGISFAVNPTTLLEEAYRPLKLYHPTKSNVKQLLNCLEKVLEQVRLCDHDGLIIQPEDLSLSRMDLTADLYFSEDTDLSTMIRLFRKAMVPRYYKRRELPGKEDRSFSIVSQEISFLVYDKIFELKEHDRCPKDARCRKVLRLEVSMRREAFLEKLDLKWKDSLYRMLRAGYRHIRKAIAYFLDKLFPSQGSHLTYPKAVKRIEKSRFKDERREQMLFILEKTSRGAGLDTAVEKWRCAYNVADSRGFARMMGWFDKLDVNPVTLTSDQKKEVPCLRELIWTALDE